MPKGSQRIPTAGKIKHVTYETAYQVVKSFEHKLAKEKFDLILGIARSGIVPATMISQAIEVPVAFVLCGRTDQTPKMLTPATLRNKKVLVVEDIIGLGLTIGKVAAFAKKHGAKKVTSFCLFYDKTTTTFTPDYGVARQHFMHAQWDRKNLTPASRKAFKAKNGRCTDADTTEFIGIDATLNKKVSEKIMTFCGINKNQQTQYMTALTGSAATQARQIVSSGISKYFTDSLERAVHVANKTPCTDVYYWGIKDRMRIFANSV